MMDRRRLLRVSVLIVAGALLTGPAAATMRFGPLQISGNLQSQNIVRTPDAQTYQFIQNRNVARIQLVYDWLQGGKLMDRYNIPFIRDSKLYFLGRGVYDSVYDTTPGFAPRFDIHGNAFQGNLNLPEALRSAGLSQNTLRLRGLSRDARDSTNQGCSVDVWFRTRSRTIFIPRAWASRMSRRKSSSVPCSGATPKCSAMS